MKKTPMQELLDGLNNNRYESNDVVFRDALDFVMCVIEQNYIEKEMAEIIEAFHTGMEMQRLDPNSGIAEEYYSLRFKTKEK